MRFRPFRFAIVLSGLCWLGSAQGGGLNLPGGAPLTARSRSEQFFIYGGTEAVAPSSPRTNGIITLIPSLTAMSCERVKSALLARIGAVDRWQSRICIVIAPADRAAAYDLAVVPFAEGWQYRVLVPSRTPPRAFVQATIRTLLLEIANRTARERSTEIPHWVAEGLTEEVMATSGVDLVVDAPSRGRNLIFPLALQQRDIRGDQTLIAAHQCLRTNVPLTVEQLSWPENGVDHPVFRASSHLLVRRLLDRPGGESAMQRFLVGLPANFNWQTTFLNAFSNEFDSLRTLEKWWLLESSRFVSQSRLEISPEPGQEVLTGRWTATESWKRLEEILRAPVQLHADSNALPARSVVSLQTALEEWEVTPLRALFTAKVRELDALQVRLHLSVVPLAGQYREVLAAHLIAPDRSRTDPGPRSAPAFSLRALNRDTARHLNLLDTRRTQLASTALQMSENAKPPGAAVVAKPERE